MPDRAMSAASAFVVVQSSATEMMPSAMPKMSASVGRHFAGRNRPRLRPLHNLVDIAVEVHIERIGRTGSKRGADDGGKDNTDRR